MPETYAESVGMAPGEDAQRIGPVAVEWKYRGDPWHLEHAGDCVKDSLHAWVWHDCAEVLPDDSVTPGARFGWRPSGIRLHTVVALEPLTITASLFWPDCCGLHGFVTEGAWVSA